MTSPFFYETSFLFLMETEIFTFFFHFNLAVLFVSAISLQVYFVDGAHKSNKKDGKDASDKKKRQDKHSSQKDRDKEARKLLT